MANEQHKEIKVRYVIKQSRKELSLDEQMRGLPFQCDTVDEFVNMLKREENNPKWADIFE